MTDDLDEHLDRLFQQQLQADPNAPPWARDCLRSHARHQVRRRDRLLMAAHLLLGGPVVTDVAQYVDSPVQRAAALVTLRTDWPRWCTPWRRSTVLEAR